jgi:hypothetical protein
LGTWLATFACIGQEDSVQKMMLSLCFVLGTASVALVACGEKDPNYKSRMTDAIAQPVGGAEAQAAAEFADQNGLKLDIAKVEAPATNGSAGQGIFIKTDIYLNNVLIPVTTNHFNPSYSSSPTAVPAEKLIGGILVRVSSYCKNGSVQCQYYYILIEASKGGDKVWFGLKYNFVTPKLSTYTYRSSAQGSGGYRNFDEFVRFMDEPTSYRE